jgi:hypothetical protein
MSTCRFAHLCRSLPAAPFSLLPRSFTLITCTTSCSRQLPSCVAVYPRASQSRRILCRQSLSSVVSRLLPFARPLPRGCTGHVAVPNGSIVSRLLPFARPLPRGSTGHVADPVSSIHMNRFSQSYNVQRCIISGLRYAMVKLQASSFAEATPKSFASGQRDRPPAATTRLAILRLTLRKRSRAGSHLYS